jgi:hypothetical protein
VATILVIGLSTERGDLELALVLQYHDDAKLPSHRNGAPEELLDLLRPGRGGDIIITRLAAQQKITHAAADPERRKTGILQPLNNRGGAFF